MRWRDAVFVGLTLLLGLVPAAGEEAGVSGTQCLDQGKRRPA